MDDKHIIVVANKTPICRKIEAQLIADLPEWRISVVDSARKASIKIQQDPPTALLIGGYLADGPGLSLVIKTSPLYPVIGLVPLGDVGMIENFEQCSVELVLEETTENLKSLPEQIEHVYEKWYLSAELEVSGWLEKAVFEGARDPIIIYDSHSCIVKANQRAVDFFGYDSLETLAQHPVHALLTTQLPHTRDEKFLRLVTTGSALRMEAVRNDGKLIPVECVVTQVKVRGHLWVALFIRDMSQRDAQVSRNLRNRDLQVQQRLEREYIDLKERFLALIAREFRQPLVYLHKDLDLLLAHLDHLDAGTIDLRLQQMRAELSHYMNRIEDALTLYRSPGATPPHNPQQRDLGLIVRNTVDAAILRDNRKLITLHIDPDLPLVWIDERRWYTVVDNILSNALAYSVQGTPIEVSLTHEIDHLRLVVADQGMGIEAKDLQRIFEPFERGQHADGVRGVGLGLAVAQQYVKASSGSIQVDSTVGTGTTVTVTVPLD